MIRTVSYIYIYMFGTATNAIENESPSTHRRTVPIDYKWILSNPNLSVYANNRNESMRRYALPFENDTQCEDGLYLQHLHRYRHQYRHQSTDHL